MQYVYYILVFYFGVAGGFFLKVWLNKKKAFGGTIYVKEAPDKTVYTLEVTNDPENLKYQDQILFKIAPYEESLNRE